MEDLEITQADRDFAELFRAGIGGGYDLRVTQIAIQVARHRIASTEALQSELASIRQMAESDQAELAKAHAENARLRGALNTHATRFEHCAEMIEQSFYASGTLRAEWTIKAKRYALEARQTLKETTHDAA